MDIKIIKKFSDITRTQEEYINTLWNNEYLVVQYNKDISKYSEDEARLIIHTYSVKKRSNPNETRDIYFPYSQKLKTIFKITSKWLVNLYTPPKSVHGFLKNRGIRTNAKPHLECNFILKLDLCNFYEQVTTLSISKSLIDLGVESDLAALVSKVCTVDGKLVQGFSTSPVISNIVTRNLDILLEEYCGSKNIIYTRYADDMSFSTKDSKIDSKEIENIIESYGFEINKNKTSILKRGFYQSVTGLTVFDSEMPRIPKRIKRKLRLECYYINKYGIKNHAIRKLARKGEFNNNTSRESALTTEINNLREKMEGWINYSRAIEPVFSSKIQQMYEGRK